MNPPFCWEGRQGRGVGKGSVLPPLSLHLCPLHLAFRVKHNGCETGLTQATYRCWNKLDSVGLCGSRCELLEETTAGGVMAALRDLLLNCHKSNAAHSRQGQTGRENSAARTKVRSQPGAWETARCESPSAARKNRTCPLGTDCTALVSEADQRWVRLSSGKGPAAVLVAPEVALAGVMGSCCCRKPHREVAVGRDVPRQGPPRRALCWGWRSGKVCALPCCPGFGAEPTGPNKFASFCVSYLFPVFQAQVPGNFSCNK